MEDLDKIVTNYENWVQQSFGQKIFNKIKNFEDIEMKARIIY